MSYKIASYISFLLFAVIGIWFYSSSLALPPANTPNGIGPAYFPKVISILMVITCIVGVITTYLKNDERVQLPKLIYMLPTIVLSILFVIVWSNTGKFYITSFILIFCLLYLFNQDKHSYKKVLKLIVITFIIVLFIFVIFDYLLSIQF